MNSTEQLIAALERLDRAATPGPWECPDEGERDGRRSLYSADDNHMNDCGLGPYPTHSLLAGDGWHGASYTLAHPADAELIAALRNALPALIRQQRQVADAVRTMDERGMTAHVSLIEMETERVLQAMGEGVDHGE
jgi:hypothetical protein